MRVIVLLTVAATAAGACRTAPRPTGVLPVDVADSVAVGLITPQVLARHTRELSSRRYEGRAPGTRGEMLTVQYIEREFRRVGLAPGNPDGSYRQRFDLFNQHVTSARGRFLLGGRALSFSAPADFGAQLLPLVPHLAVDSAPLVFVGHGVVAPELGWDDYKDVDVRGKIVVCLTGVPNAAPEGAAPTARTTFGGFAPSYYELTLYKRRIAAERGAAAMVLLGADARGLAAAVRMGTWHNADTPTPPLFVNLRWPGAVALLAAAGLDSAAAVRAAGRRDFRPSTLGAASFDVDAESRRIPTQNVVAKLEGSDPVRRDEYVVFTAHWDAWGIRPAGGSVGQPLGADSVSYGAADNAAGTAGLMAIAEALAALRPRPPRTVVFLATVEERNYAGARHYARHPLYPLERTVGNVNLDLYGAPFGRARDLVIFGEGRSTLDDVVQDVVRRQGRRVSPDSLLSEGIYLRMDHLLFAEAGVPSVSLAPGFDLVARPAGYARQALDEWVATRYHAPGDTIYPAWDWEGLVLDMHTSLLVGLRLARDARWPEWQPTAEFYARRRQMLEQARRR
jgi:Peptidase family M28